MDKVAHYRRALWGQRPGFILEDLMREALKVLPQVAQTKFRYRERTWAQINNRFDDGKRVGCYFTLFSEGDPAAIVQNGGARVGRTNAPRGTEFLKSGVHIVVESNSLAFVSEGRTSNGQITGLLQGLFEHCNFRGERLNFQIVPRAGRNELERLLKEGVKEIRLGVSLFDVEASELNSHAKRGSIQRVVNSITSPIKDLFAADLTPAEMEAASEIEAELSLGFDGRSAGKLTSRAMGRIASRFIDESDDFKIITMNGDVITPEKLAIKAHITVEGDHIALDPDSVFSEVCKAMREWRKRGVFAA